MHLLPALYQPGSGRVVRRKVGKGALNDIGLLESLVLCGKAR